MFAWLFPETVEPVTVVDDDEELLRYAHCDGSVAPGSRVPRDLTPSGPHAQIAGRLPPGAVVCMATAWRLHAPDVGGPSFHGPIDIVGSPRRLPVPGTRTFYMELRDDDVEVARGLCLTTRLRTAFDLARLAPLEVGAQALLDLRATCSRTTFDAFAAGRARSRHARRALQLSSVILR